MYRIVDANIDDIEQIVHIENSEFEKEKYDEAQLSEMLKLDNYKIFVLKNKFIVLGYIIIYRNIDFDEIFKVAINKKFRRQGLGTVLLSYVKNNCKNKLFLELKETNVVALEFYKKNGFVINGERKNYYGTGMNAILMEFRK